MYAGTNQKVGRAPPNKTYDTVLQLVREHIESFQAVESHYVRANTRARYLAPGLNISNMHNLYVNEFCSARSIQPVKFKVYRSVFVKQYNIRFVKPKKDQCVKCNCYNSASVEEKARLQESYDCHKQQEKDSLVMKKNDKITATNNPTFVAVTFDLESYHTICWRLANILQTKARGLQLYHPRRTLLEWVLLLVGRDRGRSRSCGNKHMSNTIYQRPSTCGVARLGIL